MLILEILKSTFFEILFMYIHETNPRVTKTLGMYVHTRLSKVIHDQHVITLLTTIKERFMSPPSHYPSGRTSDSENSISGSRDLPVHH